MSNIASSNKIWDWIKAKAEAAEQIIKKDVQTIKKDIQIDIKDIRSKIADYIDQHAQAFGDKVENIISKMGTDIEKAIAEATKALNGDIDRAVDEVITRVATDLHLDPTTTANLKEEIKADIDGHISSAMIKVENAIASKISTAATSIHDKVIDFMHHLAQKIRG